MPPFDIEPDPWQPCHWCGVWTAHWDGFCSQKCAEADARDRDLHEDAMQEELYQIEQERREREGEDE